MSASRTGDKLWEGGTMSLMLKRGEMITGTFAKLLLAQADLHADAELLDELVVLDNACGNGVVTSNIMDLLSGKVGSKLSLTCIDSSNSMVDATKKRIEAAGWPAKAIQSDVQDTKLPSDHFSHIFFNFGPGILPDPDAAMRECFRMLKRGGTLGTTSWERPAWIHDFRECFEQHPELPPFPSEEVLMRSFSEDGFKWTKPDLVRAEFETNGFIDVKVEEVSRMIQLDSYREVVAMFPTSLGVIAGKWTEDQREKHKEQAEKFCEEYLKQKYSDDPVAWQYPAIIATGRTPSK